MADKTEKIRGRNRGRDVKKKNEEKIYINIQYRLFKDASSRSNIRAWRDK
jgi:hypothetical protein